MTKIKSYDSIVVELLAELLATEFSMVRDDNGNYEMTCQHVTREQLETITSVMYDAITLVEIEKFGKKLLEENHE